MIQTHYPVLPGAIAPAGQGDFHPIEPFGSGIREWTFLPPIISMWCRADNFPAAQVRDNSQVIAHNISIMTCCDFYRNQIAGHYYWAPTIIEADPCEYKPADPDELISDTVTHCPGRPAVSDFIYGPTGWAHTAIIEAYGGNNDGAVCGHLLLSRLNNVHREIYPLTSPGVLRVPRYFMQIAFERMDWTGGANWATTDAWVHERIINADVQ